MPVPDFSRLPLRLKAVLLPRSPIGVKPKCRQIRAAVKIKYRSEYYFLHYFDSAFSTLLAFHPSHSGASHAVGIINIFQNRAASSGRARQRQPRPCHRSKVRQARH